MRISRALYVVLVAACHHGAPPPPPAPTCDQAADHVAGLLDPKADETRAVRGVFATRCRDDAWSADVRACVVSTTSLKDPKHCKAKLPIAARARLDADLEARKVQSIPEACREYTRVVEKLLTCDKVPASARESIRKGFEMQRALWSQKVGEESIEGCRAAVEVISEAAQGIGCPLL